MVRYALLFLSLLKLALLVGCQARWSPVKFKAASATQEAEASCMGNQDDRAAAGSSI